MRKVIPSKGNGMTCLFYSLEIIHQKEEGRLCADANSTGQLTFLCLSPESSRCGVATPKCAQNIHHGLVMLLPGVGWWPRISCRNSLLYINQIHSSSLHLSPAPNKSIPGTGLNTITLLTFLSWKAPANTIQFSSSFWKDQKIHLA